MAGRFGDFGHVLRVAALFALGFTAFVMLRAWLMPPDFGVYGYYRAGALDDVRARPIAYAGRASCAECHDEVVALRKGSRHEHIGCESCHGPLARHASGEDDTKPARPDTRTTCIRCHDAKAGKPAAYPSVIVRDHAPEGACTECHAPHHPAISQRGAAPGGREATLESASVAGVRVVCFAPFRGADISQARMRLASFVRMAPSGDV